MQNSKITNNNSWVEEGQRKSPKHLKGSTQTGKQSYKKHSEENRALQNVKKSKTTKKIS